MKLNKNKVKEEDGGDLLLLLYNIFMKLNKNKV
jgi:hypothetical protein